MPYLGKSPQNGVRQRYVYVATSGQTSFSGNDESGISLTYPDGAYIDVYQNGVLLKPGTDYTSTTGTTVVLVTGASTNDVVEMIVYDIFSVGDAVSAASGGTFGGNVAMAGTLNVTGAITSSAGATITTADNTTQLTLTSTDADSSVGPMLDLKRDSGSPADSDTLGRMRFLFDNDAAEETEGVRFNAILADASDGSEDATFVIKHMVGGTLRDSIRFTGTETVINEDSIDLDFRVEGNGDANLLYVDAGNDRIGIGTSAPDASLHVASDAANFVARFTNDGNNVNREGIFVQTGTDDGSGTNVFFAAYDGDGSETGQLRSVSGTFQLTDTSDERLKQDIVDTTVSGLTSVNSMKVRDFAYKRNPTQTIKAGFVAQELQTVFSSAVSYSESDDDKILSVSRERLVPVLVKAIQELSAKNDALEARITALEDA